jgi:hypothetical protein
MYVVKRTVESTSSPEGVVDAIRDAAARTRWQPEIVSASGPERLSEGDEVAGRARMLGFHVAGRAIATHVNPTTYEERVVVGVAMTVRYEVHRTENGCTITQELSADLPRGAAGVILSVLLRWRLRRMQRTTMERLVAYSESVVS